MSSIYFYFTKSEITAIYIGLASAATVVVGGTVGLVSRFVLPRLGYSSIGSISVKTVTRHAFIASGVGAAIIVLGIIISSSYFSKIPKSFD